MGRGPRTRSRGSWVTLGNRGSGAPGPASATGCYTHQLQLGPHERVRENKHSWRSEERSLGALGPVRGPGEKAPLCSEAAGMAGLTKLHPSVCTTQSQGTSRTGVLGFKGGWSSPWRQQPPPGIPHACPAQAPFITRQAHPHPLRPQSDAETDAVTDTPFRVGRTVIFLPKRRAPPAPGTATAILSAQGPRIKTEEAPAALVVWELP